MRSAHGGGFLYALGTKLGITNVDIVIGSSGDAGSVLYYTTREPEQYEMVKKIWTELLSTPKFISFIRPWKVMDIDYLVDTVFKKLAPLNIESIEKSPIEYYIPITNALTGKTKYVNRKDKVDIFEVLRATKAIPVFFGKKVELPWGEFVDGEMGPTLEDHVLFAAQAGATNILVIDNVAQKTPMRKLLGTLYAHTRPKGLKDAVIRDINTQSVCMTIEGTTLLCVQPKQLPAGTLTRDKKKLEETFEIGVRDALAMEKELRDLLS